jgi:hypothetical protein
VNTLGFVALALALGGLVVVVLEAVLRNPGSFLERAQDAGRFAREPLPAATGVGVVKSNSTNPAVPANDGGRVAA